MKATKTSKESNFLKEYNSVEYFVNEYLNHDSFIRFKTYCIEELKRNGFNYGLCYLVFYCPNINDVEKDALDITIKYYLTYLNYSFLDESGYFFPRDAEGNMERIEFLEKLENEIYKTT